jgi:putative transcriptional regulator
MRKAKRSTDIQNALNKFGKHLKNLRKKVGKSQETLAYECGMDKPNYRKIETGKTNPTFKTLHKLAKALKITMKELVDYE